MCICPTKSGHSGANTVGEEHLQTCPLLNVHKCVLLGKEQERTLDVSILTMSGPGEFPCVGPLPVVPFHQFL